MNDTIRQEDIAPKEKIRIYTKNNHIIFKAQCIYRNENSCNNLKVIFESNSVAIQQIAGK